MFYPLANKAGFLHVLRENVNRVPSETTAYPRLIGSALSPLTASEERSTTPYTASI